MTTSGDEVAAVLSSLRDKARSLRMTLSNPEKINRKKVPDVSSPVAQAILDVNQTFCVFRVSVHEKSFQHCVATGEVKAKDDGTFMIKNFNALDCRSDFVVDCQKVKLSERFEALQKSPVNLEPGLVQPWVFYLPMLKPHTDLPRCQKEIMQPQRYRAFWNFVSKYAGKRIKELNGFAEIPFFESKYAATLLMMTMSKDFEQLHVVELKMAPLTAAKTLRHIPNQLTPVWVAPKEFPDDVIFEWALSCVCIMATGIPEAANMGDYVVQKKNNVCHDGRRRPIKFSVVWRW